MEPLFLTDDELHALTGRRVRRLQIEALRRMLIHFHINARGHPVVTRAAVLGHQAAKASPQAAAKWAPSLVA